jgi:hypothetical protein
MRPVWKLPQKLQQYRYGRLNLPISTGDVMERGDLTEFAFEILHTLDEARRA